MLRTPLVLSKTRLDSLDEVRNLNLWGNELTDVSLLSSMPNLEIISLSINQITSLVSFSHCSKLCELYLRKNRITDVAEIIYLQGLRQLHTLWLSDNPCADDTVTEEGPWYRPFVLRMLPQLRKLDNVAITSEERAMALATNNPILHNMHKRASYLAQRESNANTGHPRYVLFPTLFFSFTPSLFFDAVRTLVVISSHRFPIYILLCSFLFFCTQCGVIFSKFFSKSIKKE
jgi:hypothetical protein